MLLLKFNRALFDNDHAPFSDNLVTTVSVYLWKITVFHYVKGMTKFGKIRRKSTKFVFTIKWALNGGSCRLAFENVLFHCYDLFRKSNSALQTRIAYWNPFLCAGPQSAVNNMENTNLVTSHFTRFVAWLVIFINFLQL